MLQTFPVNVLLLFHEFFVLFLFSTVIIKEILVQLIFLIEWEKEMKRAVHKTTDWEQLLLAEFIVSQKCIRVVWSFPSHFFFSRHHYCSQSFLFPFTFSILCSMHFSDSFIAFHSEAIDLHESIFTRTEKCFVRMLCKRIRVWVKLLSGYFWAFFLL